MVLKIGVEKRQFHKNKTRYATFLIGGHLLTIKSFIL
jgi:hypothetical protein